MKAMIFAAGLGSRLRPLTDHTPKALLEVAGKPLLGYAIEKLVAAGVTDIIVNIHHLGAQIAKHLSEGRYPGINIVTSDEQDLLLDTGGGLKNASWFFDDGKPFYVYNADVLTDMDLSAMMNLHCRSEALVTVAVSDRHTARYLLFDDTMRLHGWTNEKSGTSIPEEIDVHAFNKRAFSGIHIIDPAFLPLLDTAGAFPIIPEYIRWCKEYKIMGYDHTGAAWLDIGKPESFPLAEAFVKSLSE